MFKQIKNFILKDKLRIQSQANKKFESRDISIVTKKITII